MIKIKKIKKKKTILSDWLVTCIYWSWSEINNNRCFKIISLIYFDLNWKVYSWRSDDDNLSRILCQHFDWYIIHS